MSKAINDCLAPSYFVSYSHVQEQLVLELKDLLRHGARSVWYDRDNIVVGDLWAEEIRRGVEDADQLVLFVCRKSLESPYVAAEVRFAREGGKIVSPIVVETPDPFPDYLGDFQYLDISGSTDAERKRQFATYFADMETDAGADTALKLRACRGIWPRWSMDILSDPGRIEAGDHAARLDRWRPHYAGASAIQLNAGLMKCLAGDWDDGLAVLRAYARAANNLPGWLFLAMHLLRGEPVRTVAVPRIKEALAAAAAALRFGPHPLVFLTLAILETGGDNCGDDNLARRMEAFEAARRTSAEDASEYARAFWSLKPSFPVLGSYEAPLKARIREIVS